MTAPRLDLGELEQLQREAEAEIASGSRMRVKHLERVGAALDAFPYLLTAVRAAMTAYCNAGTTVNGDAVIPWADFKALGAALAAVRKEKKGE